MNGLLKTQFIQFLIFLTIKSSSISQEIEIILEIFLLVSFFSISLIFLLTSNHLSQFSRLLSKNIKSYCVILKAVIKSALFVKISILVNHLSCNFLFRSNAIT
ncbi:hypothetical protein HOG21_08565 [bacterium]|nr:hypothetical protein [bacterium]